MKLIHDLRKSNAPDRLTEITHSDRMRAVLFHQTLRLSLALLFTFMLVVAVITIPARTGSRIEFGPFRIQTGAPVDEVQSKEN